MSSPSVLGRLFAVAGLTFALLAAPAALAQMYRWVDDRGAVVFSQSPPPDGRPFGAVAPPPAPVGAAEPVRQPPAGQPSSAVDTRRLQVEEKKRQADAAQEAERRRNCDAARKNLELILNRPPHTRYQMPDGEVRRFTDEEREAEIRKARDFVDRNCR